MKKSILPLVLSVFAVQFGHAKIYVTDKLFNTPVEWTDKESQANEIVGLIKSDAHNKGRVLRRVVAYIDGTGAIQLDLDGKASNASCGFEAPNGIACTLVPGYHGARLEDFSKATLSASIPENGSVKIKLISIVTADDFSDH